MVFSSSLFVFYFLPLFLILYFIFGKKQKNFVLLLFSIVFYSWGAPIFIFVVLFSLALNYYIVENIYRSDKTSYRRYLLAASLIINLGLLAYFKYANFFIDNVNQLLNAFLITQINWTKVALPIGISFFTFQSLTYTLDVYRGVHSPLKKLSDYLLYILMFPQLIAGPIVRFHTIADQIEDRSANITHDNLVLGFYRFVIGLAKKVLIANSLGIEVDKIFSDIHMLNSTTAWIGILSYAFQIYFDFSGYSDMAIGIGRMIGFKFPENFNNPYISQNITEFWRRWHITLGAWMKDYLYIPLGGSRVHSKYQVYLNLCIVFLISGLWHGASWNFVIWGAYHGLFLILDKIFLIRVLNKIGKFPRVLLTFLITIVGWVFFRVESFHDAIQVIQSMFSFHFTDSIDASNEFLIAFLLAGIFSFITLFKNGGKLESIFFPENNNANSKRWLFLPVLIMFILSVAYITSFGFNPFIYFRF